MTTISEPSKDISMNFNIRVMQRLLRELSKGPRKITNLAMLAKLNHTTCKNYVHLMGVLNWIEIEQEERYIIVSLTERGDIIRKKLQNMVR